MGMYMVDWFDPENIKHIEAYEYLCKNGKWPDNFIPDFIDPLTCYLHITRIQIKMSEYWVRYINKNYE